MMIRLRARGRRTAALVRTVATALALAALMMGGCGSDGEAGQPGAPATTQGASSAPSMTTETYIAHIAGLTIAVEEGLSGQDAAARAIELGSKGYSREEVAEFALTLRSRPEAWVEIEREVERRIVELRSAACDGTGDTE